MKQLTIDQVFASDYGLSAPFIVDLENGAQLQVEQVLRYLPGKRLACKTAWKGETVFAKLFYQKKSRHTYQREIQGAALLKNKNINSASLLETRSSSLYQIIIYEYLSGVTLSINTAIKPAFEFIARLHNADLIHNDLHVNNLFFANNALYLLDAGAVEKTTNPVKKIENLALFIAQFPLAMHNNLIAARTDYELARGIKIPSVYLANQVKCCWEKRKKYYLKKIFSNCTEISLIKSGHRQIFIKRNLLTPAMKALLENPDSAMDSGILLKDGNAQTVSMVMTDGARLVIKRYNQKSPWNLLKRKLGINRARNCWRYAHLLGMTGIHTPAPVAIIEEKSGGIYYISSHVDGEKLSRYYRDKKNMEPLMPHLKSLFDVMHLARLAHGDLKASNIMVMNDGLCLIDLDAMSEKAFNYSYRRKKDMLRFQKNFEGSDTLIKIKSYLGS